MIVSPCRCYVFYLLILTSICSSLAQVIPSTKPQEGLRVSHPTVHALVGATVIPSPGEVLDGATVIVRDGLIEVVGVDVVLPPEARIHDLSGHRIYAGFIDAYAMLGKPLPKADDASSRSWSERVHPERNVLDNVSLNDAALEPLRSLGFTTAHLVPKSGIFRGRGALVQLSDPGTESFVLRRRMSQCVAFETGGNVYPKSLMGCMALMRQVFSDARWHRNYVAAYSKDPNQLRPGDNLALGGLAATMNRRDAVFFLLNDEAGFERAASLATEAKVRRVYVDAGYAYREWRRLKKAGGELILTLNFPDAPDLSHPDRALDVSLERLQHWEQAPSNPAVAEKRSLRFSISTHRLENPGAKFWPNLRKAVQHGLSESRAVQSLTTAPALMFGMSERLGRVSNGLIANLTVTKGNPFVDDKAAIAQVWIDGQLVKDEVSEALDVDGTWQASWSGTNGPETFSLRLDGKNVKLTVPGDEVAKPVEVTVKVTNSDELAFTLEGKAFGVEDKVRLSGYLSPNALIGQGAFADGTRFAWSADRASEEDQKEEVAKPENPSKAPIEVGAFDQYPAGAYPGLGAGASPRPQRVFIENATIWTCGPQGVLEGANLVVDRGKIVKVGKDVKPDHRRFYRIDGTGMHVTPGLVDCHSHTAISGGVNEGSHSVTCEVRIGDVVDPTDIGLYWQLAGGLTSANLLHGSANAMGGQNQVIKLRWGKSASNLAFRGAKPGVKFALGENVKQANWGERFTKRYPQTRMGVEQVMRDAFLAARAYERQRKLHEQDQLSVPFRTDFRMEALVEILNGDRLVHIHSYRQDEILMFVRLAQEFGFKVGTFQHVLEGYKVADAIAEIGAGASSFSDWWAYKFEVYDAIPHNGALLREAGVLTSFNSDDRELARRLNTEAAKAVKYGNVSPEEALKFVTINPARQLQIHNRVGSLEIGKDADFAVWNGPPLSTLSRCEQTWIDGALYFSRKVDEDRRQWVERERKRLTAKVLSSNDKDKKSDKDADTAKEEPKLTLSERLKLLSPWGAYHAIDYAGLYHDGQSLHTCTGCYCDFR